MRKTYEDYQGKFLAELRIIGRELGVKAPTTLKKEDLIKEIVSIENGAKEPYKTKRGRPSHKTYIASWSNKEIEEKIKKKDIEQAINDEKKKIREEILSIKGKVIVETVDIINHIFNEILNMV